MKPFPLICLVLSLVGGTLYAQEPEREEGPGLGFELCTHPQSTRVSGFASKKFLSGDFRQRQILVIAADTAECRKVIQTAQHEFALVGLNVEVWNRVRIGGVFTSPDVIASTYPPESKTPYYSGDQISQKYLWRSLGWLAPDFVIVWKTGDKVQLGLPGTADDQLDEISKDLQFPLVDLDETHLASALTSATSTPAKVGHIPSVELTAPVTEFVKVLTQVLMQLAQQGLPKISNAHAELIDRKFRQPLDVCRQLDQVYGHHLKRVTYQPALSLIARLNLDDILGEQGRYRDVEKIVEPYLSGEQPTLGKSASGSVTAGHLVFSELAHRLDAQEYTPLVKRAADQIFDENGQPLPVMPAHHEMSDAVFMAGPILAAAGRLTGKEQYYDLCLQHIRYMQKLCRREDGIYRHSPLDEAAWGRGNGFPALGLALVLSEIPKTHPAHQVLLKDYRQHLSSLSQHQDIFGMWHQVIDEPGSYREMTSTCMITFAIIRGLRNGWLDEEQYLPIVERAIPAIVQRMTPEGELIDVCTGTGKQKNLQAYYDRTAILGTDERGGAMIFLVMTEYTRYLSDQN